MIAEPLYNSFPPEYEPNDAQEYILGKVDDALQKGYKYIMINAPTGTGKSFIAKTLANHSDFPTEGFVKACNGALTDVLEPTILKSSRVLRSADE